MQNNKGLIKLSLISAFSVLCTLYSVLCLQCNAQETLTITTYYPSPSGSYHELKTDSLLFTYGGVPANPQEGMLYYDSSDSDPMKHGLRIYVPKSDGTLGWEKFMTSKEKVLGSNSAGSNVNLPASGFGSTDTEPTIIVPAFEIDMSNEGSSLARVDWEGTLSIWVKPKDGNPLAVPPTDNCEPDFESQGAQFKLQRKRVGYAWGKIDLSEIIVDPRFEDEDDDPTNGCTGGGSVTVGTTNCPTGFCAPPDGSPYGTLINVPVSGTSLVTCGPFKYRFRLLGRKTLANTSTGVVRVRAVALSGMKVTVTKISTLD